MRLILLIKIIIAISCLCVSLRIIYINGEIDKSISAEYQAIGKLRGDPALDTAENRKIYLQKKTEINKQIDILNEKKYPASYSYIGLGLAFIASLLAQDIYKTLFKKPI